MGDRPSRWALALVALVIALATVLYVDHLLREGDNKPRTIENGVEIVEPESPPAER
ncbi:MAG: hypothetical protein KAI97_05890 [Gemmatimonadetes bacterium]|nr:hypothetical protein [Gemmatimonadota bacterium]